ncbi:MAG: hypothetical protein JRM80_06195 [Nitrososphaerota archaeon]|nr:hypothetical protein [Nitrososphaerota archaeon]
MRKALISLMCHPERSPKLEVPPGDGYEAFVNRTPNYAAAYRTAIGMALEKGMDLVTADSDGYHPASEIVKLATGEYYEGGEALVLPYRTNLGFQSKLFSYFFSLVERRRIRDATGGLCRFSYDLMRSLPSLAPEDMTVHVEILKHALKSGAKIVQYGYLSGANERAESRRTSHYQLKLLKAAFSTD